jgi:hypothetical protein
MTMKGNRIPMDCVQFGELLPDIDRPGTRGSELCEEALAHAESCAPCAAMMMEAESLNYGLRRLSETTIGAEAPARVGVALLNEFRRAKSAHTHRNFQRDLAALAIAALVLLAVGLGIYRHQVKRGTAEQLSPAAQSTNATAPDVATAATTQQISTETSAQPATAESVSDSSDNEYATAFVPLPYADDPSETQGGAVVRVNLPRASLVSMGVPVAGLNPGGHVIADLMLSEDGTPQAIRLVSQSNPVAEF